MTLPEQYASSLKEALKDHCWIKRIQFLEYVKFVLTEFNIKLFLYSKELSGFVICLFEFIYFL
jgi:hypothetical protein